MGFSIFLETLYKSTETSIKKLGLRADIRTSVFWNMTQCVYVNTDEGDESRFLERGLIRHLLNTSVRLGRE
jgi:hypothetical protein